MVLKKMIIITNVTKEYTQGHNALKEISFHVKKGDIMGLTGKNGTGKSTLLKILSTIIKPSSGDCKINGYDVVKFPFKSQLDVGLVLGAELGLYDHLTGFENIMYFGKLYGKTQHDLVKKIKHISEELDLNKFLNLRTSTYSRGMKLRTAIARSIVHDPKILLLDEPTSGLDPNSTKKFYNMLLGFSKQSKAILISSHNQSEVNSICNKKIELKSSEIENHHTGIH